MLIVYLYFINYIIKKSINNLYFSGYVVLTSYSVNVNLI